MHFNIKVRTSIKRLLYFLEQSDTKGTESHSATEFSLFKRLCNYLANNICSYASSYEGNQSLMLQGIYWSSQEVRKELPCPIYEQSSDHRLPRITLHFPSSLDTSPSPEAANCWDRPTIWLSRPESSRTRGAHSHVSSLKWHQRVIKCNWAVQAQS